MQLQHEIFTEPYSLLMLRYLVAVRRVDVCQYLQRLGADIGDRLVQYGVAKKTIRLLGQMFFGKLHSPGPDVDGAELGVSAIGNGDG